MDEFKKLQSNYAISPECLVAMDKWPNGICIV